MRVHKTVVYSDVQPAYVHAWRAMSSSVEPGEVSVQSASVGLKGAMVVINAILLLTGGLYIATTTNK